MVFTVGSVLRQSLLILGRNAAGFGIVAVVFTLPAIAYSQFLLGELAALAGEPAGASGPRILAIITVGSLALFLLQSVAAAILCYGTIRDLRGGPAGLWESLRGGLPAIFRVVGITLLLSLLIVLATFVAAIPGGVVVAAGMRTAGTILLGLAITIAFAMILTRYWIAIPVAVVEAAGVIASLKRSAAMTKGQRWRVFGLILVLYGLNFGVAWLTDSVTNTADLSVPGWPAVIVGLVVASFFLAWRSIAAAVAYHDLRIAREGRQGDEVARVFD